MNECDDPRTMRGLPVLLSGLGGFLIFLAISIGTTYYLQSSLIVVWRFGAYAHWGVILVGIPILIGLVLRLIRTRCPGLICLAGAVCSAGALYPIYHARFWADPPPLAAAAVLAFAFGGVSYSVAGRPFDRLKGLVSFPRWRPRSESAPKERTVSESPSSRGAARCFKDLIESPIVRVIELMITVLSFVLAVFSVFIMGRH